MVPLFGFDEVKKLAMFSCLLAACASTPRSELGDHAVFEGYAIEQVREAAGGVLEELAYGQWDVRVHDRRVLTEGRIGRCGEHVDCDQAPDFKGAGKGATPWTTVEVRFEDVRRGTAVEVGIEYESDRHCQPGLTEPRWLDVECIPERLGSTGALEGEIVERVRARLEQGTVATGLM